MSSLSRTSGFCSLFDPDSTLVACGASSPRSTYTPPFSSRYSSKEMSFLFSDNYKFSSWRKLWLVLATAERELGLTQISDGALAEMQANVHSIDFEVARIEEARLRHDVMAHVHTFAKACPTAGPIIHLGATSCFVTDNADLITLRSALTLVINSVVMLLDKMRVFAKAHRALATLGSTHFQAAQPTTVGKRCTVWMQDIEMDLEELVGVRDSLLLRGAKGTTGTQASFLALFDGDHARVEALDRRVAELIGFPGSYRVTGQTYPRKVDFRVLSALAGLATSSHRLATDLRLLAGLQELEEPFEANQIGSSAMAYKRNPMRCERVCALARYVTTMPANASATASVQWLERTLDDSANRRLTLSTSFLAIDGVLALLINVFSGLVVYPKIIEARLRAELPFMATENIIMAIVKMGGDRQVCHEHVRVASIAARQRSKETGEPSDLVDRIRSNPYFAPILNDLDKLLDPKSFVGRAPQQVDSYIEHIEGDVLVNFADIISKTKATEINV